MSRERREVWLDLAMQYERASREFAEQVEWLCSREPDEFKRRVYRNYFDGDKIMAIICRSRAEQEA